MAMFAAGTWLYYYALQINDELNANQLKNLFLAARVSGLKSVLRSLLDGFLSLKMKKEDFL